MSTETETSAPSAGGWRSPLLLAGLGLVLMVGGYKALNYVPLTPRQAEQDRQLSELRRMATEAPDNRLADRLNEVAPPWQTPPYQMQGRLAFWAGLFLFVMAGLLMYRHRPAPRTEPSEEEGPDNLAG